MSLLARTSTVSAATLGSRLLGFARDAGTAAVLGAGPLADALMAALSVPLLARRLLAEGAFNAALIPALSRAEGEGAGGGRRLARATLLLLTGLLAGLAVAGAVFMPWFIQVLAPGFSLGGERADLAIACGRIALLYLPLAGAAAVYGAVANGAHRVLLPALAPLTANAVVLVAIVGLLAGGLVATAQAALVVAGFTVLAGIAQLVLMICAARGAPTAPEGDTGRADWRASLGVLRASAPALLFAGLSQVRLLLAAAVVSSVPGSVAALNYAQRLVDLPLGLVGASAGAVLVPLLASGAAKGDKAQHATGAALAAFALAFPAGLGLLMLAEPIVTVLYQRASFTAEDTLLTSGLLQMLALSLPAQGLERVLCATAMSHGLERPVERIGLGSLVLALVLAVPAFHLFGPEGAAGAVAASALASALAMLGLLVRRGHLALTGATLRQGVTLLVAGGAMAGLVALASAFWPASAAGTLLGLARLGCLVGVGMAAYGGVWLMGRAMLSSGKDRSRA